MTIDKIAWILLSDDRILSTRSKGKTNFYIPGGKREFGESDEDTLVREIQEELSVDILPATIRYIGTFIAPSDGASPDVMVKMTCYEADYIGTIQASNEIEVVEWLEYKDLDRISAVDKLIFQYLLEKGRLK